MVPVDTQDHCQEHCSIALHSFPARICNDSITRKLTSPSLHEVCVSFAHRHYLPKLYPVKPGYWHNPLRLTAVCNGRQEVVVTSEICPMRGHNGKITTQKYVMLKHLAAGMIHPTSLAFMWEHNTKSRTRWQQALHALRLGSGGKVTHPHYCNLIQGTVWPRAGAGGARVRASGGTSAVCSRGWGVLARTSPRESQQNLIRGEAFACTYLCICFIGFCLYWWFLVCKGDGGNCSRLELSLFAQVSLFCWVAIWPLNVLC